MVGLIFTFSALTLCTVVLPASARPAPVSTLNTPKLSNRDAATALFSVDSKSAAKVKTVANANEPRWDNLGENFVLPGNSKAQRASALPVDTPSTGNRLNKRVFQTLKSSSRLVERADQEQALEEAIEMAKDIMKRATTVSAGSCAAPANGATCRLTADCAGEDIPANSHHYCDDNTCSWVCNSNYKVMGSQCVSAGTNLATKQCKITANCAGVSLPANAHAYCDQSTSRCTFQCNTGFSVSSTSANTCVATAPATKKCTVTANCAGVALPANAHAYCDQDTSTCTYECNTGYSETMLNTCIATVPIVKTCQVTADCSGADLPPNSHAYCDQSGSKCTYQCNSGYSQLGNGCVRAGTATTTTDKTAPTRAPNVNYGIISSWKQKTSFFSKASFLTDMGFTRFSWGDANTKVVQGVPANSWAAGAKRDTDSAVQVRYPVNSRNPSNTPIGGFGFYASPLDVSAATNASLSYSVFFPKDFDFVKGGKLPGLYGGKNACSGGDAAEDCFSARLMFRTGGMGEVYLYAPREKQTQETCTLGPLSYCNTVDGMSIGRGSWTFTPGQWTDIRQDIWLNTPGVADGGFNIWVNNRLALSADSVYYRNSAVGGIVTNGTASNITLIDYDNLPADIVIPNGGFVTDPTLGNQPSMSFSLETKVVSPTASPIRGPRTPRPDLYNKRSRIEFATATAEPTAPTGMPRRATDEQATAVSLEKRAASNTLPVLFKGLMFHTFFGGSSPMWNSPKTQYSYYKGVSMSTNKDVRT